MPERAKIPLPGRSGVLLHVPQGSADCSSRAPCVHCVASPASPFSRGTISRSRPYSPQPSFPPLPKGPPSGGASPLRDVLRSVAPDGVRPDSPLTERRAALRNRKLEAQLEAEGVRHRADDPETLNHPRHEGAIRASWLIGR
eukprot:s6425_g7.t1